MLVAVLEKLGIVLSTVLVTVIVSALAVIFTHAVGFTYGVTVGASAVNFAMVAAALITAPLAFWMLRILFRLRAAEEKLLTISTIDDLTQVFNRRHVRDLAGHELHRAARYGYDLSLALVDIDDFAGINATHGTSCGDEVLRRIAQICVANSRNIDYFARYSGGEFLFVLPQSDSAHAKAFAERMRSLLGGTAVSCHARDIMFTVSMGVATYDGTSTELEGLLRLAEQALRRAKHEGKDRVVAFQPKLESRAAPDIAQPS